MKQRLFFNQYPQKSNKHAMVQLTSCFRHSIELPNHPWHDWHMMAVPKQVVSGICWLLNIFQKE